MFISPAAHRWSSQGAQWQRADALTGVVVGLPVIGFSLVLAVVVPQRYRLGQSGVFGVGVGIAAYTLGMRHALDADHIGAIDNMTAS